MKEPKHPGEVLRAMLEEKEMTQAELARRMGTDVNKINTIVNQKRGLSLETCSKLAKAFGTTSDYWINLDIEYKMYKKGIKK